MKPKTIIAIQNPVESHKNLKELPYKIIQTIANKLVPNNLCSKVLSLPLNPAALSNGNLQRNYVGKKKAVFNGVVVLKSCAPVVIVTVCKTEMEEVIPLTDLAAAPPPQS